jgi:tyrosinase
MTRRDFIILAHGLGLSAWFGDVAFAQASRTLVTRKSATAQSALTDIETLRKGVKALLGVADATKYASWMYWANSHCTPDPIPPQMDPVWCRCAHTPIEGPVTLNFLPWHRAYLFFFEALIRELTKQAEFALPYWDWYASTIIPPAFTGHQDNALNWQQRRFRSRTLLRAALSKPTFTEFSGTLEGNPHGTVHVMVNGDMGAIETSARDPLFWAHHTNIDRLWSVWLADTSHKNPDDEKWLGQPFVFDLASQKRLTVTNLLRTEELGYVYDNLEPAGKTDAVPPRPANVKTAPASVNLTAMSDVQPNVLSQATQLSLSTSTNLAMKVPGIARDRLAMMGETTEANAPKLALVLYGLRVTEAGRKRGFEYRIYVNLPRKPSIEDKHEDFFVGTINSFQLSHHLADETMLVFPIEQLAPALAKKDRGTQGK